MRGVTWPCFLIKKPVTSFQSTLPMRGVTVLLFPKEMFHLFQSTLPMRGVTLSTSALSCCTQISIHTPHAGSDGYRSCSIPYTHDISIHTPHAGSDFISPMFLLSPDISIHTPHAGSDSMFTPGVGLMPSGFQSTLPMRGVTIFPVLLSKYCIYFNPHSPCGE